MSDATYVPVLIVGGGISGLSTAAFLSYRGIPCLLLERKPDLSKHPRMTDVGPRSMEIFRGIGLEDEIRAVDEGTESVILRVDTLVGQEYERHSMGGTPAEMAGLSPTEQIWCDQDQLEPIVRRHADLHGAEVRFGTELVGFEQDTDLVRATVRDGESGAEHQVSCDYLLACDGIHSPIREQLGIQRHGPGPFAHQAGILFRADLSVAQRDRNFVLCMVDKPDKGDGEGDRLHILLRRNLGRWTLSIPWDPASGEQQTSFTEERCTELIRSAVGLPDVQVEVIDVDVWPMQAMVADRFRAGRVLLVGDAAHALPPTGGFGGNSCIQDAHNLAWKLTAVLDGDASDRLLDSYDAERRPIADLNMEQSLARAGLFHSGAAAGGAEQPPNQPDKSSVTLGYRYLQGALLPETGQHDPQPAEPFEDPRKPSGAPGARAPHIEVVRGAEVTSILDLFGAGFVLLTGPDGEPWQQAARQVRDALKVEVAAYRVGPIAQQDGAEAELRDVHGQFSQAYGISSGGAVLVRPDGFVAWRQSGAAGQQPATVLPDVVGELLCRSDTAVRRNGSQPR